MQIVDENCRLTQIQNFRTRTPLQEVNAPSSWPPATSAPTHLALSQLRLLVMFPVACHPRRCFFHDIVRGTSHYWPAPLLRCSGLSQARHLAGAAQQCHDTSAVGGIWCGHATVAADTLQSLLATQAASHFHDMHANNNNVDNKDKCRNPGHSVVLLCRYYSVDIVWYHDMKCHDISISSLAYDMNTGLKRSFDFR